MATQTVEAADHTSPSLRASRWRPPVKAWLFGFIAMLCLVLPTLFASRADAVATQADFFGLNTLGQLANAGEAEDAQSLGIHNVRVDFTWGSVQSADCSGDSPSTGLDFSDDDNIVRHAAEHEITIIANLYQSRASCHPERFPKPGTVMYGAWKLENSEGYVWDMVQRYGVNGEFWSANPELAYHPIRVWEVWNEENLPGKNPGESIDPQKYAQFLVDTGNTIRKAQEKKSGESIEATETKVLMGGLAPGGVVPFNSGTPVDKYFDSIYSSPEGYTASKFHNSFDGLSFHPYALEGNATAAEGLVNDARGALTQSRSALGGESDSAKSLWLTELGWSVMSKPSKSSTPSDSLQVKMMASFLPWIYTNADTKPKIKYAGWYANSDNASSCSEWSCWWEVSGLRHSDGSKRPSWCAYADIIQVNFCNSYPVNWSGDENLGGGFIGDPSISSWESGRLDAFGRGYDNALWHKWYTEEKWSGWQSLGGSLTSGPDAVSWGSNRIDAVALSPSLSEPKINEMWHKYWNGSAWNEDRLGGGFYGDPAIASWESGRLDVFGWGMDNALWHDWYTPGTGWSGWQSLGGYLTSSPDAVSWAPNRIDVVARTSENHVFHWYWNGSSWNSDDLGPCISSSPSISSSESGRLDVFGVGCWEDNELYQKTYTASGWSGWGNDFGWLTSGVDAVSWGKKRIDLVGQDAFGNSSMMHAWLNE